jgi:hypothetical protein
VDPPPASDVDPAGAASTSPGDDGGGASGAAAPGILIEHPVQGAAVERGEPIPSADAQPLIPAPVPPAEPEHPAVTIARIREKLYAYGAEVYEKVRPELEYLQSLCGPGPS